MKGSLFVGMATGTILGAAVAWALSGDLNARGMMRISRKIGQTAGKIAGDM
jgi:predicted Zn-dependent protease